MNIRDIAERAGYGVGTVSRVLNGQPNVSEQARERILAVVDRCGYEPNSNARYLKMRSQTHVAAFVMGVGNRLFDDIIGPLQAELSHAGEELIVTYLDDDANEIKTAIAYQQARHPKGMVFLGGELKYFEESFQEIAVPSVLVTNAADSLGFDNLSSVSIDNEQAAACVIEHLIEHGHRRIGIIGGNRIDNHVSTRRLSGAERALRAHDIAFDYDQDYEPCPFLEYEGYRAALRLLKRSNDLTAIFALGDVIAFGALRAIVDQGLSVPGDISLVGFDDTALSQYAVPRITTICQNAPYLAKRSAEILIEHMNDKRGAVHEIVPFELMTRESVQTLKTSSL